MAIKKNNHYSNLEWVTHSKNSKHAYSLGLNSRSGERNGRSKLKQDDVSEIRWLNEIGVDKSELSKIYGVGLKTIYDIVAYRTWKHI